MYKCTNVFSMHIESTLHNSATNKRVIQCSTQRSEHLHRICTRMLPQESTPTSADHHQVTSCHHEMDATKGILTPQSKGSRLPRLDAGGPTPLSHDLVHDEPVPRTLLLVPACDALQLCMLSPPPDVSHGVLPALCDAFASLLQSQLMYGIQCHDVFQAR